MQTITKTLLILLGVLSNLCSFSQEFSPIDAGIIGVGRSSVAWGDYDADGDLDLLITGNHGSGPYIAAVYRNDNGTFTDIHTNLTGIDNSSVAWGDYDNDGDLDILATGRSDGSTQTWLYRNKYGVFTAQNAGLPDIGSYGCVAWGDYDGDGDLDALISGGYFTYLYQNGQGTFTNTNTSLPGVSNSWVNFGDFDNDGDLDIFVMGDVGGWPISAICRNDDGIFTELDSTGIIACSSGTASWNDYDHDNDLDLVITGFNQFLEPTTSVFSNDGNLSFTSVSSGLEGSALGTAAWGDFDNDGDADLLITGQNAACGSQSSVIYRNDGKNNFINIDANLEGTERGSADWGDFDNDGDLDIVISGFNGSGLPVCRIYRNNDGSNVFSSGFPPEPPTHLNAEVITHQVILNWIRSVDNSTPAKGITYNLRVGTFPGGQDVFSSFTDPVTSAVLVPKPGNVSNDTSWILNLPDGNYFWSVQALDNGLATSAFAGENQFTILNVGITGFNETMNIQISKNPLVDYLTIKSNTEFKAEIVDSYGKLFFNSGISGTGFSIPAHQWPSGIYILRLYNKTYSETRKLIKE